MKLLTVIGTSNSGKTTLIQGIIAELRRRRYTVGAVKEIHSESFQADTPGKNSHRMAQAGAQPVTARGLEETALFFRSKLPMHTIYSFYDSDYLIMEGVTEGPVPRIVCGHNRADLDARRDDLTMAFSGRVADTMNTYKGLPILHAHKQTVEIVDRIVERCFEMLPDFPAECCSACGMTCHELAARILQGSASRADCRLDQQDVVLTIDGQPIAMVPFVQRLLKSTLTGLVKELRGFRPGKPLELRLSGK